MLIHSEKLLLLIQTGWNAVRKKERFTNNGMVDQFIADRMKEIPPVPGEEEASKEVSIKRYRLNKRSVRPINRDVLNRFVYVCMESAGEELGRKWANETFLANGNKQYEIYLSVKELLQKFSEEGIEKSFANYSSLTETSDIINRFIESLQEEYQSFATVGNPIRWQKFTTVTVKPLLIPVGNNLTEGPYTIDHILANRTARHIIISGSSGSGKTFLWRYVIGRLTATETKLFLPIDFADLMVFDAYKDNLFASVVRQWQTNYEHGSSTPNSFSDEEWGSLIDTLSITSHQIYQRIWIIDNFPSPGLGINKVLPKFFLRDKSIIFSHYPGILLKRYGAKVYRIAPLSNEQQKQFIQQWFGGISNRTVQNLCQQLQNQPQNENDIEGKFVLTKFIERPLYLAMVCDYYERHQSLPDKPEIFIQEAVEVLLEKVAECVIPFEIYREARIRSLLGKIALFSYVTGDRKTRKVPIFDYEISDIRRVTELSDNDLFHFLENVKILVKIPRVRYQTERIVFDLDFIREWLAAEQIYQMGSEGERLILATSDHQGWTAVRRFYNQLTQS